MIVLRIIGEALALVFLFVVGYVVLVMAALS